jgi:hypothetical protein
MNQDYLNVITNTGRPIPGQSLTSDPNNPAPYEQPPQFTSIHEASEYIFNNLIQEETYVPLMRLLLDDMPIMDIAQTLIFTGFTEGKWNPDLMVMLAEPVAYMLLALAERAGIDPVIYRGEDEDDLEEEEVLGVTFEKEKVERMQKMRETGVVPKGVLTKKMEEAITDIEPPQSLLNKIKEQEETGEVPIPGSLLAPPAEEEEQE